MKNIKNKSKKLATQALALTMATSMIASTVPVYAISTTSPTGPILMKAAEPYQLSVVGKKLQIKPLNGKELKGTVSINNRNYNITKVQDYYQTARNVVLFKNNDIGITSADGEFKSIDFKYKEGLNYADGFNVNKPVKKVYGDELATRDGISISIDYEYNINFGKDGNLIYDLLKDKISSVYIDDKEIPLRIKVSEERSMPTFIITNNEYAMIADNAVPDSFKILEDFDKYKGEHKVALKFQDGSIAAQPKDYNPWNNKDDSNDVPSEKNKNVFVIEEKNPDFVEGDDPSTAMDKYLLISYGDINLDNIQKITINGDEYKVSEQYQSKWSTKEREGKKYLSFALHTSERLNSVEKADPIKVNLILNDGSVIDADKLKAKENSDSNPTPKPIDTPDVDPTPSPDVPVPQPDDSTPEGTAKNYKFDYSRVEVSYSVEELRIKTTPTLNMDDVKKIEVEGQEIPLSKFSRHWSGTVKAETENLGFTIKNKENVETLITFKDGSVLKYKSSEGSEKPKEDNYKLKVINGMASGKREIEVKKGEKITLYASDRPQNAVENKTYSFKEWKVSKGNVKILFDEDNNQVDGKNRADDAYFIMPAEDVVIEAIYNEKEIEAPKKPDESEEPVEKIAPKYQFSSAELTKEGYLNLYSTPKWNAKDMAGIKKLKVNDVEFNKPDLFYTITVDALQTKNKTIVEEALKKQPASMEITFKDDTVLSFEANIVKQNPFDVTKGVYTIGFKAYQKGTEEKSQMQDYLDNVVKYEITDQDKKIVTFAMDAKMADMIKDFAIKGPNDEGFISSKEEIIGKRKEYRFELNDLAGKFDGAIMVMYPGSSAKESDKGNYSSASYTNFDLYFNDDIEAGFRGFKIGKEMTIEENNAILVKALINEGFDKNDDGQISAEELQNGIGTTNEKAIWGDSFYGKVQKGLNLSGLKLINIDMLKDLGPGVDAINLEGNDIKSIPDNLFSKATGLKWLFMSGNDVESIGSKAFEGSKELKYVDFDGNKIKEIPAGLFDTNLKLEEVSFPGNGLETIPEGLFDKNENLTSVYLYDNNLRSLPDDLFKSQAYSLSFDRIDLFNNKLESLPSSIGNLLNLNRLCVQNNNIKMIPDSFKGLTNLKTADFENNLISVVPEGFIEAIVKSANQASVEHVNLNLSRNHLSDFSVEKVKQFMNKNGGKRIDYLCLGKNFLKKELTPQEKRELMDIGVIFTDNPATYFPQMSAMEANIEIKDNKIMLNSEFDLLDFYYWTMNPGKFEKVSDFKDFIVATQRDNMNISRSESRDKAIKKMLNGANAYWEVETRIYKNDELFSKVVRKADVEGLNQVFEDSNMKSGDRYRVEKEIIRRVPLGMERLVQLNLEGKAQITEDVKPIDKVDKNYKIEVKLKQSGKESDSMANQYLNHEAKVLEKDGQYTYTIDFSKGSEFLKRMEIKEGSEYREIESVNGVYTFTSKEKYENKILPIKVKIQVPNFGGMNQEADLKFGEWVLSENNVIPTPDPLKPGEKVDKTKLEALINEKIDSNKYTSESLSEYNKALEAAKKVLMNKEATQDQVEKAITNLNLAIKGLVQKQAPKKEVNKTILEFLINKKIDSSKYTNESLSEYNKALETAKKVFLNKEATQDQVNKATESLDKAIQSLVEEKVNLPSVDKTYLRNLIDQRIDLSRYTLQTQSNYKKALENAENIYINKNSSQLEVNRAVENLASAIRGLTLNSPNPISMQPTSPVSTQPINKINVSNKYKNPLSQSNSSSLVDSKNKENTPKANPDNLKDIKNHWAKSVIEYVVNKGYFIGTSENTFSPNQAITGGQFLTVLGRRSDVDTQKYDKSSDDLYYASYIKWANEENLLKGLPGELDPSKAINREQMAQILNNYLEKTGYPKSNINNVEYKDSAQISNWAKDSIDRLSSQGILKGMGDGKFSPDSNFTRAQIAQVLYNIDKN